jgi:hypothetical protein
MSGLTGVVRIDLLFPWFALYVNLTVHTQSNLKLSGPPMRVWLSEF